MSDKMDLTEKTILIVEDEPNNCALLEAYLASTHAKVITTAYGLEAFAIIRDQPIDLVLMDIRLPDSNGLEITAEIRKTHPNLPIIAQTAFAQIENKDKALFSGCNDFMAKPIREKELFSIIKTWI
ncbi:MAG: response regulator [Bacteroidales bacterium]|nr:response regulator [Bacteroidales bacterium]